MTSASQVCPHCGSHNHRTVADHVGRVGWCSDCHRTWEPAQARPSSPGPAPGERERQPG